MSWVKRMLRAIFRSPQKVPPLPRHDGPREQAVQKAQSETRVRVREHKQAAFELRKIIREVAEDNR